MEDERILGITANMETVREEGRKGGRREEEEGRRETDRQRDVEGSEGEREQINENTNFSFTPPSPPSFPPTPPS